MPSTKYVLRVERVEQLMRDVSRLSAEIAIESPQNEATYALNRAWKALYKTQQIVRAEAGLPDHGSSKRKSTRKIG